jgi:hypothetical protein
MAAIYFGKSFFPQNLEQLKRDKTTLCWKKHLSDFLILCSTHGIHPAFGELELQTGFYFND